MGHIYAQRGELDNAEDFYLRALEMAKEEDQSQLLARTYFSLGVLYSNLSDLPKALENYQLLYDKTTEIGDVAQQSETIISIGGLYDLDGDFDSAIACYQHGLMMSSQLDAQLSSSIGLIYLAESYADKNDMQKALLYAKLAVDIVRILQKSFHLTGYLNLAADIELKAGNYKEALQFATESTEIAASVGASQTLFLSTLLIEQIKYKLATQSQSESIANLEKLLDEDLEKDQEAHLYYAIWKIDNSRTLDQDRARRLFQELFEKTPIYDYHQIYVELGGTDIPYTPRLPKIDSILKLQSVDEALYLSRIRNWLSYATTTFSTQET